VKNVAAIDFVERLALTLAKVTNATLKKTLSDTDILPERQ